MTDKLTHHELTAEWVDDNPGRAIMLTQPSGDFDEPNTVLVHPWQLRAVCEQFGIIASDSHAAKTIATLQRRMMGLCDRIESLADYMAQHSDHKHADLSFETTQLQALQDLAREWCHDFDDGEQAAHGTASEASAEKLANTPAKSAQAVLL